MLLRNPDGGVVPDAYRPVPVVGFRAKPSRTFSGLRLTLGTDFSGLEVPSWALKALEVDTQLVFVSEISSALRAFIATNFAPATAYRSAQLRESHFTDLYVAGPPCVKHSALGTRSGEPDSSCSTFELTLLHFGRAHPNAFVIENVMGVLTSESGSFISRV